MTVSLRMAEIAIIVARPLEPRHTAAVTCRYPGTIRWFCEATEKLPINRLGSLDFAYPLSKSGRSWLFRSRCEGSLSRSRAGESFYIRGMKSTKGPSQDEAEKELSRFVVSEEAAFDLRLREIVREEV